MKFLLLIPFLFLSLNKDSFNPKLKLNTELQEFSILVNELKQLSSDLDSIAKQTDESIKIVKELIKNKTELN